MNLEFVDKRERIEMFYRSSAEQISLDTPTIERHEERIVHQTTESTFSEISESSSSFEDMVKSLNIESDCTHGKQRFKKIEKHSVAPTQPQRLKSGAITSSVDIDVPPKRPQRELTRNDIHAQAFDNEQDFCFQKLSKVAMRHGQGFDLYRQKLS